MRDSPPQHAVLPPTVPPDVPPKDTGGRPERELRLVATYADRKAARRAIEALSLRGIDGGRIHLVDVDPTSFDRPVPYSDRRTDAEVGLQLEAGLLKGTAWGFLCGGVLVGTGMLLWMGLVPASGFVGLGGGLAGMMVGASIGLFRIPIMADAWGESNRPVHEGADTVLVVRLRAGQDPTPLRRILEREGRDVSLLRE